MAPPAAMSHHRAENVQPVPSSGSTLNPRANPYLAVSPVSQLPLSTREGVQQTATGLRNGDQPTRSMLTNTASRPASIRTAPLRGNPISSRRGYLGPLGRRGPTRSRNNDESHRRFYNDRALPMLTSLPSRTKIPALPRSVARNTRDRGDVGQGYHSDRENGRPSYSNSHPNPHTDPNNHLSENMIPMGSGNIPNGNNSYSSRGLPILMQNDWKKTDEISIRISGIPLSLDLYQLYNIFSEYGEVECLELYQNDSGISDGNGRVKLSNVERPFWEEPFIYSLGIKGPNGFLKLRLEAQQKHRTIQSPVDKQKSYPQKYVFKLSLLQFGILYHEDTMMPMFTTADQDEASLEVDLYRRTLDIVFKIWLKKDTSADANPRQEDVEEGDGDYDDDGNNTPENKPTERFERYRFRIPFIHLEQLIEVETSSTSGRAFLIDLPSAPFFWRKLHDPRLSIDDRVKFWTSWNAWFRQTSITFDNSARMGLPVSLEQRGQIINIGRWTTYRFEVGAKEAESDGFNDMTSALKDFNIKINVRKDLKTLSMKVDPIWDSIAIQRIQYSGSYSDQLHQVASSPLLSYPVRYQLEVCISHNCLNEYNITPPFIDCLAALPAEKAIPLLEHVAEKRVRYYDPMNIFAIPEVTGSTYHLRLPDHCQLLRKANVTPSTVYFTTPTVEITNRVVRQYSEHIDRFLRVQFVDEKFQGRINSTDKKTMHEVFTRVKAALDNGITIGDRKFEFLAFGNSQIREHGAYFFASTDHLSAADIRAWMGSFKEIRIVAKHAARLGQCFSTTRAISGVQVDVRTTKDIVNSKGYNFSDGVGKISEFLARLITTELRLKLVDKEPAPSCFQFRLGGRKGVLAVSPDANHREVYIRPSQLKFEAKHSILEVIRWSKFATAALNRQLIIVLTSLGAPDRYFEDKLQFMLKSYEEAMVDPGVAVRLLCKNVDPNESTLAIAAMIRAGFMARREPFVMSMLKLWRAWTIKYLKEKAKIMIEEGAFVLGVVDETGTLDGYYDSQDGSTEDADNPETSLPQIFLQVTDPDRPGESRIIEGPCVIARNPSLHPGDVRKVMAVNAKELHHLRNVVVFSQKGDRDLPNMLSGGDLDGDDYIIIWDKKLTSCISNYEPMNYSAQTPRELERDVEIGDITKFFVNYMKNDKLGTIANAHLAWADKLDEGVKSDECFRLATLHSDAVDYVKSGEPAIMPPELRRKTFPHFMEKQPEKTYRSDKILGVLYDSVSKIDFVPAFELEFDDRILNAYTLNEKILEVAQAIKIRYDAAMRRIMAQHDIYTEFEVISTFIMHHSMATKDYKFHEDIANICNGLKDTFKKIIYEVVASKDDIIMGPFIAAMYSVTHQEMAKAKKRFFAAKAKKAAERAAKRASGNEKAQGEGNIPAGTKGLEELAEFTIEEARDMPLISFPWLFGKTLSRIANREYPFRKLDGSPADFKQAAAVTDELEGRMGKKHTTYPHGIYDDAVAITTPGIQGSENDIPDNFWNGESSLGISQRETNPKDVTTTTNKTTPATRTTTINTSPDSNTVCHSGEVSLI